MQIERDSDKPLVVKGMGPFDRTLDCLVNHACVPGSNYADADWGF